jgi:hypothetical protein
MLSDKIKPYNSHPEACLISCYFNTNNYSSRRQNFDIFYRQLQRSDVNYLIAECAFGNAEFELPDDENIFKFRSKHKMWQKERLLNLLIKQLKPQYKYIFWLDADVLLKNENWITEAVEKLKTNTICQPFSVAVRLEKNQKEPNFNVEASKMLVDFPNRSSIQQTKLWRSFAYNYCNNKHLAENLMFDIHGHTGFAWGMRRELLDRIPLFDKAIVGTADHIIAHASVGQIPHNCLEKAFTNPKMLENIYNWSIEFNRITENKLDFVESELWHLWHGELKDRQYLQRTQDFNVLDFDEENDLVVNDDDVYEFPDNRNDVQVWMNNYFESRHEDGKAAFPDSSIVSAETDHSAGRTGESTEQLPSFEGFGGNGDFDGGGAGGSWENYS